MKVGSVGKTFFLECLGSVVLRWFNTGKKIYNKLTVDLVSVGGRVLQTNGFDSGNLRYETLYSKYS